jgi:hypothetical protein
MTILLGLVGDLRLGQQSELFARSEFLRLAEIAFCKDRRTSSERITTKGRIFSDNKLYALSSGLVLGKTTCVMFPVVDSVTVGRAPVNNA